MLNASSQRITVGIADMKTAQREGELITYALGSCIGICLYDPMVKLAAMVHIMLPLNMEAGRKNPLKYADTGIRDTLAAMIAKGAMKSRITAKIAGGAKMFETTGGLGNIGQRNIESVRMMLKKEGVRIVAEDVGGTVARTMSFDAATGQAVIHSYGKPNTVL